MQRKKSTFRRTCGKCADSGPVHPGLCSPFIHSVVSNDSVSGQWRPWSDCADAQADLGLRCPHTPKDIFSQSAAQMIRTFSVYISLYWNPYMFISNWSQRQPLLLWFIHCTGNDVTKIYRKDQFLRLRTIHMYSFPLTLSMMGKNYIRRHFKTFEYFFPEKVALRNFMQKETIFMKCQILFSGKNKKT